LQIYVPCFAKENNVKKKSFHENKKDCIKFQEFFVILFLTFFAKKKKKERKKNNFKKQKKKNYRKNMKKLKILVKDIFKKKKSFLLQKLCPSTLTYFNKKMQKIINTHNKIKTV
jgi:hypothetical protein